MIKKELFNKWYSYSKEKGTFLIDGCDGSETTGNSFYKYYALNDNSVDALTHMYVYATHPNQFNDPFDCDLNIIDFDDIKDARILWEELSPEVEKFCGNNEMFLKYTNLNYKTILYKKMGVLCLSQQNDNLAMWNHYTNHRGFCIEVDIQSFPFKKHGPYPINYQEKIYPISIKEHSIQIATIIQTNIKQKIWEYEHEWRLLVECPPELYMKSFGDYSNLIKRSDDHDRKFYYPVQCLKSITLGLKFFDEMKEIINNNLNCEAEIITSNKLQQQVLDFISFTRITTFWLVKDRLKIKRQPIIISKLTSNIFRVIY